MMKKRGILATGIAVGMLASMGIQAFAGDAIQQVVAYINDSFRFNVNGESKELDDEYHVLVYNDRSYLPVRGLGEMIGADIDWDNATNTISIKTNSQTAEPPADTPTDTDKPSDSDSVNYRKLPQTYEVKEFRIDAESYYTDNYGDRIYLKIENKEGNALRLIPSKTEYVINGETYGLNDVAPGYWDERWYTRYIEEDAELEGYLRLPMNIKNLSTISVHIELQRDGSNTTYPVDFDIQL